MLATDGLLTLGTVLWASLLSVFGLWVMVTLTTDEMIFLGNALWDSLFVPGFISLVNEAAVGH